MGKWLMVLGASYDQIPMLETARSMGLQVVAVDKNPKAPGRAISDDFHPIDVMDSAAVLEAARSRDIAGITTMVSNLGMRTVAEVARELGLPAISPEAARRATDKTAIKAVLERAGVPVPGGAGCSTPEQARSVIENRGLPAVVKPADGTKGRGISLVDSQDRIGDAVAHAFRWSPGKRVIVEEQVQGPTVGAECLIVDNQLTPVLITDKFNTHPPWFVTLGLTTPSRLPEDVVRRVEETARAVARALELTMGAAHIDMIVQDGVPRVIDVGPRLASGPVIFDFAPRLMGVNMIEAVIRMALGERPVVEKRWNGRYGASRFLTAAAKGCMYTMKFPASPTCFSFYPYRELGYPVGPPRTDKDRLGCVALTGPTYEETSERADQLVEAIEVRVAS
ncbi:MAG: ATP-grasp domain-containing protein [bacterium]|nr:ATP-grasp domain-containing protein [bacterium]